MSVTRCCTETGVTFAATTSGSATKLRTLRKVQKYALHGPGGSTRAGEFFAAGEKATHVLLNKLGHLATDSG